MYMYKDCADILKKMKIILIVLVDSIIQAGDLTQYRAELEEALRVTLNDGSSLYSPKPPSSGAILSFILKILDGMCSILLTCMIQ